MVCLFLVLLITFCQSQSGTNFISYHVYDANQISGEWDYYGKPSDYAGYITANSVGLVGKVCVEMTSSEKTIYVVSLDAGGRGFDLNLPAFCELCGDEGGFAAGGCNINWQVVDYQTCADWRAGKTQPDCDMCPAGTICNNPDPNRSIGVDWDTYCPTLVNYGMRRCDMRIDGCTCYTTDSTLPPPNPPPQNPPPQNPPPQNPPPSSGPCTATSTYTLVSGDSCSALATRFGVTQDNIYDVTDGNNLCSTSRMWVGDTMAICGGSSTTPPPPPPPPPSTPPPSTTLPPPSTPPPSTTLPPPSTPPPTSTNPPGKTTTRCGVDWSTADTTCGSDCQFKEDCPGGNCFASLSTCVNGVVSSAVEEQSAELNANPSQNLGLMIGLVVAGVVVLVVVIVGVFYWKYKSPVVEIA